LQNYFNYFTEVEERFQKRRGTALLLNTLDWALIETWRDAGIPLEAALQGIDNAFDKYDARAQKAKMRRVNGLAWCAQAVMEASEAMGEAAIGGQRSSEGAAPEQDCGIGTGHHPHCPRSVRCNSISLARIGRGTSQAHD